MGEQHCLQNGGQENRRRGGPLGDATSACMRVHACCTAERQISYKCAAAPDSQTWIEPTTDYCREMLFLNLAPPNQ